MLTSPWVRGPVGIDAGPRLTRTSLVSVLVMVPTMAAGTRLMDLVTLLDGDHRVQVVFTVPHTGETWHGLDDYVRSRGGVVLPWQQVVQHRWDLVLSASHRHIEQVHGKLLLLPHGAGSLMSRRFSRKAGGAIRETTGLDRELLTYRGRVMPAALCLTHDREVDALRESCPEALAAAVVAGDICLDRIAGSVPLRAQYRRALGIEDGQRLVTISSTWTPESTFGSHPELYLRLVDELGHGCTRVAAVLHPHIWAVHGAWQVRAWLAPALRHGLIIIPPSEGWQATLIASDQVVGDHGSTTLYAAALGIPVHLAAYPDRNVRHESPADHLAGSVSRLDHRRPLAPQLRNAPRPAPEFVDQISSRVGHAARIFRTTMYTLLELSEPSWPAALPAVSLPDPITRDGNLP